MNAAHSLAFVWSFLPRSPAERDSHSLAAKKSRPAWPLLAATAVLAALGGLHRPADAQVITWDFTTTSGSWTEQNVREVGPPPAKPRWEYGDAPKTGYRWSVTNGQKPATGNVLTSPLITLDVPADTFTFTMAHRYRFTSDDDRSKPIPLQAGQLEYSLDGKEFLPVFGNDWVTSGAISGNVTPFANYPTWVAPTYIPGVNEFPLVEGGASFVAYSPGALQSSRQDWVGSQTLLVDFPGDTTTLQFRLTHANLGGDDRLTVSSLSGGDDGGWGDDGDWDDDKDKDDNACGWEVRWAEVEIVNLPEPSTYALLGACLSLAILMWRRR